MGGLSARLVRLPPPGVGLALLLSARWSPCAAIRAVASRFRRSSRLVRRRVRRSRSRCMKPAMLRPLVSPTESRYKPAAL
jgi:hypothetical protein